MYLSKVDILPESTLVVKRVLYYSGKQKLPIYIVDMCKIYAGIICILLLGCNQEKLSYVELAAFASREKNGLIRSAKMDNSVVSVTYRPTDLWVYQELDGQFAGKTVVNSLRKKYSSYYYFILSLSSNNKEALHQVSNPGDYGDVVQTLSFKMPEYVSLTTAALDTIPVGDFSLSRTFGLGRTTELVFAFDKSKVKQSEWVQFNLDEFGLGLGSSQFRFSTEDLENTPTIDFHLEDN